MGRRKTIFLALTLVVVVFASTGAYFFLSGEKEDIEEGSKPFGHEVLKIDGNFVSSETFISERNAFFERHKRNPEMLQKGDEERNDMLLDQIIENIILDDYAFEKSGIEVADEEVDEYISRFIDERYSKPMERTQFMTAQGYKDEEEMREGIHEYILKHKLFHNAAIDYGISVDKEEIEKKYKDHKMQNKKIDYRHIFISLNDRTKEDALTKAEDIYERLLEGEDFEEMAKEHSENEETSEDGGLVTDAIFARVHPELNKHVFSAQVDQLLEPVKISNGYEIVYVKSAVEYFRTIEEYEEMLVVNEFLNSDEYNKWIEELKKNYEIEILDPEMKAYRLYRDENYNEAASMYEELYKDESKSYYIVRAMDSYTLAENWTDLVRLSEKAIEDEPDNIMNYLNGAVGYFRVGDKEKALELLQKSEEMSGDNLYWQDMINNTYNRLGLTEYMKK
ncbi:peptidylprolyl isomerase [Herbivorax sp. ANBcel31]|uniref:peptidylprolyl isomerase n=1 Tax=Herbivorax sp. ANBcel31 TaxID=3069754 RepID=UPI0027AEE984|nr:peptidylprolyl isomerase [Herbivorax sp. ANBcel31]MDQ2085478.1 peptidylprolyl isomerase [Herbivorax sp. ANBcel31]